MNSIIKLLITATMLFSTNILSAQADKLIKNKDVEGIYLNLNDFKTGKLTRPTDKMHKGDKIKLKQFFISPDIVSVEQDKETVFYKDSIFAIRLSNGENYRFINRNPSFIADTSYLYIYTYQTSETRVKQMGSKHRAVKTPVTYYYFSNANHDSVYILSKQNVCKHALLDPKVHLALCNKFDNDAMLYELNKDNGRFILNETIISTLKQNR